MANTNEKPDLVVDGAAMGSTQVPEDARKPYEAPRLLKKRSVAQATLLTAKGPTSSGLISMG